jgi:hypothetical protein
MHARERRSGSRNPADGAPNIVDGRIVPMNRYHDDIQEAIANLGDHLCRAQMLTRYLAESRGLDDADLDPEVELAIVCWLEEADAIMGRQWPSRRLGRPLT